MPNEAQIEILWSGAQAWNAWRKTNPHAIIDLAGAQLNKINLADDPHGVDLEGVDLHGVHLNGAKLNNARLKDAKLIGAQLDGAILSDTNLIGAVLSGASMVKTRLNWAKINRADFSGVTGLTKSQLLLAEAQIGDGIKMPNGKMRYRFQDIVSEDFDLQQAEKLDEAVPIKKNHVHHSRANGVSSNGKGADNKRNGRQTSQVVKAPDKTAAGAIAQESPAAPVPGNGQVKSEPAAKAQPYELSNSEIVVGLSDNMGVKSGEPVYTPPKEVFHEPKEFGYTTTWIGVADKNDKPQKKGR